ATRQPLRTSGQTHWIRVAYMDLRERFARISLRGRKHSAPVENLCRLSDSGPTGRAVKINVRRTVGAEHSPHREGDVDVLSEPLVLFLAPGPNHVTPQAIVFIPIVSL